MSLSFTCKDFYQTISLIIQKIHPIIFTNNSFNNNYWNLIDALMEMYQIKLDNNLKFNNFINNISNNYCKQVNDLSEITKHFILEINDYFKDDFIYLNEFNKLFSFKINKEKEIKQLTFNYQNLYEINYFDENYKKNINTIQLNNFPLTFTIKSLQLTISCYKFEFYDILQYFYNLEYLELKLFDSGDNSHEFNFVNEDEIKCVPLFEQLKELVIVKNELVPRINVVIDLIKLSPNLEHFTYFFTKDIRDENIFKKLIDNCKNLEYINISSDTLFLQTNYITDFSLLQLSQNLTKLKYLTLMQCNFLNGSFFKEITKFTKNLKYLKIQGADIFKVFEKEGVDVITKNRMWPQIETIILEGKINESKLCQSSEEFVKSLENAFHKVAPNLIHLEIISMENNKNNFFFF
ncbi:hypothetical protein ABK040_014880 [Willaertia magna]